MDKRMEHITKRSNGWAVKRANGLRASKIFKNKSDAIRYAEKIAHNNKSCAITHDESGKIEKFTCETGSEHHQHVVHKDGMWQVHGEHNKGIPAYFEHKRDAVEHAYEHARANEKCIYVHDGLGRFQKILCPEGGIVERLKIKAGI